MTACSDEDNDYLIGSQNLVSEIRDVDTFDKLMSAGVFYVTITQGDVQSVEITADDNIMSDVIAKVDNDVLELRLRNDEYQDITLRANITVKKLNEITNAGVGDIVADKIKTDQEFSISNSGTGDIKISGTAKSLSCHNEGTGDIKGFDFLVENADLKIQGSGSIETSCTENLEAQISGSGNIYYQGNPVVSASITGSGKVVKAD